MMKTILLFLLLTCSMATFAQRGTHGGSDNKVDVGSIIANLGLGVGADYGNAYYNSAFGTKASLEFGLWEAGPGVITLGGELGGSWSDGGYYTDYKAHTFVVAARSAWHCGLNVPNLDVYGGISLGLGFRHQTYDNNGPQTNNDVVPAPGIFVGASYYVTPNFGFNAEAGYDITNIQVGVVFKLN